MSDLQGILLMLAGSIGLALLTEMIRAVIWAVTFRVILKALFVKKR